MSLFHNPDWGFSGMTVSGRGEGDRQRVFLGTKFDADDSGLVVGQAARAADRHQTVGGRPEEKRHLHRIVLRDPADFHCLLHRVAENLEGGDRKESMYSCVSLLMAGIYALKMKHR
ncbi:MAG: hypothetical protein R3199_11810 [Gemmatimonadota bacterium]|nr:hypothetical protein [Gemmatimonadota bacterium]